MAGIVDALVMLNNNGFNIRELGRYTGLFKNEQRVNALAYILRRKAVTGTLTMLDLGIPLSTMYRILKELRQLGIIEAVEEIQIEIKAGPRPVIWGLVGYYTKSDVDYARSKYLAYCEIDIK